MDRAAAGVPEQGSGAMRGDPKLAPYRRGGVRRSAPEAGRGSDRNGGSRRGATVSIPRRLAGAGSVTLTIGAARGGRVRCALT